MSDNNSSHHTSDSDSEEHIEIFLSPKFLGQDPEKKKGLVASLSKLLQNPFANTPFSQAELLEGWNKFNETMYFAVSLSMSVSNVLTRFKEIEKVVWDNYPEMNVVNTRFMGNHAEYNHQMNLNFMMAGLCTLVGILNCFLIKRYLYWRAPVGIINTLVICSYLPVWNTYKFDEIFMFFVPMHVFHLLITLLSVDQMS